jgi:ATP-binding cassette, subfamily C, bacterial CydC
MIRKFLLLAIRYKGAFLMSIILAMITVIAGMGLMGTSGYLISRAALRPLITDLFMVTAAVRFFGISRAVVRYAERLVSHAFTFRILAFLRTSLYRCLDAEPLKWMMGRRPGDLLNRLVADIDNIQHAYLRILSPAIVAACISMISIVLLWQIDPIMALVTSIFYGLSGISLPILALRHARGNGSVEVETASAMKTFLVDKLQGMQDLLWMGQERKVWKEFADMQQQLDTIQKSNAGIAGRLEGLHILFTSAAALFILLLAIPLVLKSELQGVMLAACVLFVLSSFEAVQSLGQAFLQWETAVTSSKRVFTYLNRKSPETGQILHKIPERVDISFQNVSFSYEPQHITLRNVSFDIPQGSNTAIIGPSGSGKSTIVNLLLRFWEADQGRILLGGQDIRQIDALLLRNVFTVVTQDAFIFHRSLRENLQIASPGTDDKILQEVLHNVGLGIYSCQLDMQVGSLGMRLSGGERQLLALARALLRDTPVWIFDEPTANLDMNTERHIIDTIRAVVKAKTQIMITHRLADIPKMDQVIRLV